MVHQMHLETPDCAVITQQKTPQPQKDEDNILPPASSVIPPSSGPQLTTCTSQEFTETEETHQHNVEVIKQGWVERTDKK